MIVRALCAFLSSLPNTRSCSSALPRNSPSHYGFSLTPLQFVLSYSHCCCPHRLDATHKCQCPHYTTSPYVPPRGFPVAFAKTQTFCPSAKESPTCQLAVFISSIGWHVASLGERKTCRGRPSRVPEEVNTILRDEVWPDVPRPRKRSKLQQEAVSIAGPLDDTSSVNLPMRVASSSSSATLQVATNTPALSPNLPSVLHAQSLNAQTSTTL